MLFLRGPFALPPALKGALRSTSPPNLRPPSGLETRWVIFSSEGPSPYLPWCRACSQPPFPIPPALNRQTWSPAG